MSTYDEQQWCRLLCEMGVAPITASKWACAFADEIQPEKFSAGMADLRAFIPQVLHETGMLQRTTENLTYTSPERIAMVWPTRFPTVASALPYVAAPRKLANKVYAERMGNGNESSGDGARFVGRGLVQITGRAAYQMDPPPKGPNAGIFNPERIAAMAEPASSAGAGVLLAKLLPAGVGAALMVAVDPPENKRELFARLFVAFAASYLFGDVVFDMLHSFSLFSFLDHAKRAHSVAVDGIVGALGWSVLGGVSMFARKFRADPVAAVKEVRP